jgi:hypothetical protein
VRWNFAHNVPEVSFCVQASVRESVQASVRDWGVGPGVNPGVLYQISRGRVGPGVQSATGRSRNDGENYNMTEKDDVLCWSMWCA